MSEYYSRRTCCSLHQTFRDTDPRSERAIAPCFALLCFACMHACLPCMWPARGGETQAAEEGKPTLFSKGPWEREGSIQRDATSHPLSFPLGFIERNSILIRVTWTRTDFGQNSFRGQYKWLINRKRIRIPCLVQNIWKKEYYPLVWNTSDFFFNLTT